MQLPSPPEVVQGLDDPTETQRLRALQAAHLLDAGPDAGLDALTRLACRLLDSPAALVSLVDVDRQWFKSACGTSLTGIPRELSFCTHAVQGQDLFLVGDAHADTRFRDNPLVQGPPHVRAYAGAPLRSLEGHTLGTLCVVDRRPREWTAAEQQTLRDLARCAEAQIHVRELSASSRRLISAAPAGPSEDEVHRLSRLLDRDRLTGLPSRLRLMDGLARHIEAAAVASGDGSARAVLACFDIDRFHALNEAMGHGAGDAVLMDVAARLSEGLRASDVLCRLGSDQFAVLFDRAEDRAWVPGRLQELMERLAQPRLITGQEVSLSCSVGWVSVPGGETAADAVLARALVATRRAKELGGHLAVCGDSAPSNAELARREAALDTQIRLALQRQEFVLHYQPKVDLDEGRVTGVEALVRWHHPSLGMVPPSEFIPIAERSGLIVPLGDWVLREACAQLRAWSDQGLRGLSVAVNLSARQFLHHDIVRSVRAALLELPADGVLELELTESLPMREPGRCEALMRELKSLGVELSLDDFGTGYSSLSYLNRLPIDKLKIDRSFVMALGRSDDSSAIVEMIIAIARRLRMGVIAEGVETREQQRRLSALGCDKLQGFLFGRPMLPQALEPLLRAPVLSCDPESST